MGCDACVEVEREDSQNCSMLCCVRQLRTLRWAVLTVLWIGFCHTWSVSLCIDLFVFVCMYFIFSFYTTYAVLAYSEHGGVDLMGLKPSR